MKYEKIQELVNSKDYIEKLDEYTIKSFNDLDSLSQSIHQSNAIEGSTLTEGETKDILEDNSRFISGKTQTEHLEV